MRQVVDFYVLLLAYHQERKNNGDFMDISELMMTVKGCGMGKFASALMFVLISMFDIDKHLLLCTPSKKHGTFLLDEMMKGGNFGQYGSLTMGFIDHISKRRGRPYGLIYALSKQNSSIFCIIIHK